MEGLRGGMARVQARVALRVVARPQVRLCRPEEQREGRVRLLVRPPVEEAQSLIAEAVAPVARLPLVVRGGGVLPHLAAGERGVGPTVPVGPSRGFVGGVVAVRVLPDEGSRVPGAMQPRGDVVGLPAVLPEGPDAAARVVVPLHSRVVRVLAPQDRGPGGAAQRLGDVGVGEVHALTRHPLPDVGHGEHRIFGLVVGHDEQDVGPGRRLRPALEAVEAEEEERRGACDRRDERPGDPLGPLPGSPQTAGWWHRPHAAHL